MGGGKKISTTHKIIIYTVEKVPVPLVYNKTSGAVYMIA
jgi:hypothetical protein